MKFLFVTLMVVVVAAVAESTSLNDFENSVERQDWDEVLVKDNTRIRQRRDMCSDLSRRGGPANSACNSNCQSQGKMGGRCRGSVCKCSSPKFQDVWDRAHG